MTEITKYKMAAVSLKYCIYRDKKEQKTSLKNIPTSLISVDSYYQGLLHGYIILYFY